VSYLRPKRRWLEVVRMMTLIVWRKVRRFSSILSPLPPVDTSAGKNIDGHMVFNLILRDGNWRQGEACNLLITGQLRWTLLPRSATAIHLWPWPWVEHPTFQSRSMSCHRRHCFRCKLPYWSKWGYSDLWEIPLYRLWQWMLKCSLATGSNLRPFKSTDWCLTH